MTRLLNKIWYIFLRYIIVYQLITTLKIKTYEKSTSNHPLRRSSLLRIM